MLGTSYIIEHQKVNEKDVNELEGRNLEFCPYVKVIDLSELFNEICQPEVGRFV